MGRGVSGHQALLQSRIGYGVMIVRNHGIIVAHRGHLFNTCPHACPGILFEKEAHFGTPVVRVYRCHRFMSTSFVSTAQALLHEISI